LYLGRPHGCKKASIRVSTTTTAQTRAASPSLLWRGRRGIQRYGWKGLSQEVFMRSVRPALAPLAGRRVRARADQAVTVDDLLELTFEFRPYGITINPLQSRWEFGKLLEEVARVCPKTMLEIGTAKGGSLLAFAQMCAPDAHIVSVDLPRGPFGGGYPLWKVPLYKAFARPEQRLDLVRGDSHSASTFEHVQSLVGGSKLDFMFIDGDHSYEGVKADFETYKSLMRRGGIIAFHDVAAPRPDRPLMNGNYPGDVPRFWADLTRDRPGQTLLAPAGHGCFGIGLIRA
jgi:predicted O-methyltransferase YrrM